jgi:hypothetical protein
MPPKRIATIVTALVLMVIVGAIQLGRPEEPTYAGRPLSYWITRPTGNEAAIELAIKEIGVDSLPDLIEFLRRKDWPHRAAFASWVSSHKLLASVVRFGPSAETFQSGALTALYCLGPKARPALPEILPLLTNQSREIRIQALFLCTAIAPDSLTAASAMLALNDALRSPLWGIRVDAMKCLNALQPPPPDAAMLLSGRLTDENEHVRNGAMECLVARTNPIVIPLLKERLHDANSVTVTKAIIQLGAFGTGAASAEQRLRELCQDPASNVREAATNALLAVTGEMTLPRGPRPDANITFSFSSAPAEKMLGMYLAFAKKNKITAAGMGWPAGSVRAVTPYPMNPSEAMILIEDVLKQQAHIAIHEVGDGTLVAVCDAPPRQQSPNR